MPDNLDQLAQDIKTCQRCELRQNATQPVCGLGDIGAKYFLLGEAPGAQEDEVGVPFVGQAGRRLDKLLALAGISTNDCYLSNVCRCRPPSNRDPRKKEIRACIEFLWREIRLVKPSYLITLGSVPLSLFCPYGIRQTHGTQMEVEIPDTETEVETRQERREGKQRKERERIPQHGKSQAQIYKDAILKRLREQGK